MNFDSPVSIEEVEEQEHGLDSSLGSHLTRQRLIAVSDNSRTYALFFKNRPLSSTSAVVDIYFFFTTDFINAPMQNQKKKTIKGQKRTPDYAGFTAEPAFLQVLQNATQLWRGSVSYCCKQMRSDSTNMIKPHQSRRSDS